MYLINKSDISESEVTPEKDYINRRKFIKESLILSASIPAILACENKPLAEKKISINTPYKPKYNLNKKYSVNITPTSYEYITSYNNFYEFSQDKENVKHAAKDFKTRPWTVQLLGHIKKTLTLDIDKLIKLYSLEERIYRFRCVERWAMIVPWLGFQLSHLIKYAEPTSKAKYIQFESFYDPEKMPGTKSISLDWPYKEGLRMDEAMNPLAFLTIGLYGKKLPPQNGAPVRIVVPWKYGFKNLKSIVKIRFLDHQPKTTWNTFYPNEYGFYANVNPTVSHPRWSQAKEKRLGESEERKTLLFNGYEKEVGYLYENMNLRRNY